MTLPLTPHHARDGLCLRPALCAGTTPGLRRGEDPGLGDDPLFGEHHARLLRRLHLLLHHRARGRIIQSRSESSILREIGEIRDKTLGFTGVISDLGNPTANMYRIACKDPRIKSACRRLSCVYPDIYKNLETDFPALARPGELAPAARGAAAHGPRGPHRQRQAAPGASQAAGRHGRGAHRPNVASERPRRPTGRPMRQGLSR